MQNAGVSSPVARRPARIAAAAAVLLALLAGCRAAPDDDVIAEDPGVQAVDGPEGDAPAAPTAPGDALAFTDAGGVRSEYRVYEPSGAIASGEPVGLLLQFHGDEATEYRDPDSPSSLGGPDGIVEQGTSRGYLVVPVLTPDDDGSLTWWEEGEANAEYVHELLGVLESEYPIDRDDIWLVGYSGGAQFITQFFLPAHSADLGGGGAVLFGGGGSPLVPFADDDPALRGRFPMHWYAGQDDLPDPVWGGYGGLEEAVDGEEWYADAGFTTSAEYPPEVTHDLSERFGPIVGAELDESARV